MNFLNFGPSELIIIGVIALLVVGPRKLPELGRMVGKWMRMVREASDEMRRGLYLEDDYSNRSYKSKTAKPKTQALPHKPPKDDEPIEIIEGTATEVRSDGEAAGEASRSEEGPAPKTAEEVELEAQRAAREKDSEKKTENPRSYRDPNDYPYEEDEASD